MAAKWLRTDANLSVQAPAVGPVAHWELDDVGAIATDSAGSNNGALEDGYSWVAGKVGSGAVEFAYNGGKGGRVRVPHAAALMPSEVSVTTWLYATQGTGYSSRVVAKGIDAGDWEAYYIQFTSDEEVSWSIRDPNHDNHALDSDGLGINEWIHVAGTYDGNNVRLYINGQLDKEESNGGLGMLQDSNDLSIGNAADVNNRAFIGKIDDVRVYDYALTALEVAYVAAGPSGYMALESDVNIYDSEPMGQQVINFRDLAKFMDQWMDQILWP